MNDKDIKILKQQSDKMLAIWYCLLNTWEWPDRHLPNIESEDTYIPFGHRSQLMNWIENKIGSKFISRIWNSSLTDTEFTIWWEYCTTHTPESRKKWIEMESTSHHRHGNYREMYEAECLKLYGDTIQQNFALLEPDLILQRHIESTADEDSICLVQ
jgi:hypothetical protein